MNLDHLIGLNVMLQFDRALYVVGYIPDQNAFMPVIDPSSKQAVMVDVLQGKLSKTGAGDFVLIYANPMDGGKSRIQTTFDEKLVVQACAVSSIQLISDVNSNPSAS